VQSIDRSTYGFLDWLGDCGGLFSALKTLAELLVAPFAGYSLRTKLIESMFRFQESDRGQKDSNSLSSKHNVDNLGSNKLMTTIARESEKIKRV
jgi:hypothetical protein